MKYIKFLLVPMLFVSLAFMNIGGCGGSSGGGGGANCQMPALTTNFSDTGYFFTEQGTDVIIGVTSTGLQVAIVVSNFFPEFFLNLIKFVLYNVYNHLSHFI